MTRAGFMKKVEFERCFQEGVGFQAAGGGGDQKGVTFSGQGAKVSQARRAFSGG